MKFDLRSALRTTVAVSVFSALGFGSSAFDMSDMNDQERAAFREEVRAFLLDNPEVIFEAAEIYNQRADASKEANDSTLIAANAGEIFNSPDDLVLGNPDGDVTLVEFLDYRCGYCKKAHPEVQSLLESDGNIKLIIKEFPILGEASTLASKYAIASRIVGGDAAYSYIHEALMQVNGNVTLGLLKRISKDIDLDGDAVEKAMESDDVARVIERNYTLAQKLAVNGTPAFVMGDQMVRGYVPYDSLVQIVAQIRDAK